MRVRREHLPARIALGKWMGAGLGTGAWFADQQIVSTLVYASCPPSSRQWVVAVAVVTILIALAGAWMSWRAQRELPESGGSSSFVTDRFIARLSILIACFGILAIVFGSAAGLILRCER